MHVPSLAELQCHINKQVFRLERHCPLLLPRPRPSGNWSELISYGGGTAWDFHPASLLITRHARANLTMVHIQFWIGRKRLAPTDWLIITRPYCYFNKKGPCLSCQQKSTVWGQALAVTAGSACPLPTLAIPPSRSWPGCGACPRRSRAPPNNSRRTTAWG